MTSLLSIVDRLKTGANLRVELWLTPPCSMSANEKITSRPDVVYVFDWPDAVIAMKAIEHSRIDTRFIDVILGFNGIKYTNSTHKRIS
ncbi:MAG: hypothetical protein MZV63_49390 [Marinilabiliales bacterium]|nr:hypothetical protein [Marinilabiliales bacterium]